METKEKIQESATKIVFIIMAISMVALTWVGKVDAKDFVMLASMAFAFYFTKSGVKTGNYSQSSQVINSDAKPVERGGVVYDDGFTAGEDIEIQQIKQ